MSSSNTYLGLIPDEAAGGQSSRLSGALTDDPASISADFAISAAPFYLKVSIIHTGETTMLRVDDMTTVSEIVRMAEEKRNATFTDCNFQFLSMDGAKIDIQFEEMTMKNFRQIDMFLIESKTTNPTQKKAGTDGLLSSAAKAGATRTDSEKSILTSPNGKLPKLKAVKNNIKAVFSQFRSNTIEGESSHDSRKASIPKPSELTPSSSLLTPLSSLVGRDTISPSNSHSSFNMSEALPSVSMIGTAQKAQILERKRTKSNARYMSHDVESGITDSSSPLGETKLDASSTLHLSSLLLSSHPFDGKPNRNSLQLNNDSKQLIMNQLVTKPNRKSMLGSHDSAALNNNQSSETNSNRNSIQGKKNSTAVDMNQIRMMGSAMSLEMSDGEDLNALTRDNSVMQTKAVAERKRPATEHKRPIRQQSTPHVDLQSERQSTDQQNSYVAPNQSLLLSRRRSKTVSELEPGFRQHSEKDSTNPNFEAGREPTGQQKIFPVPRPLKVNTSQCDTDSESMSLSGSKSLAHVPEPTPLIPKFRLRDENDSSQSITGGTSLQIYSSVIGQSTMITEEPLDIEYLSTALNRCDFSRILQPEKQISEAEFNERFNLLTGKVWTSPFEGYMRNLTLSSSNRSSVNPPKIGPCYFKLYVLSNPPVFMKETNTTTMESFCKRICSKMDLDYQTHSLSYGIQEPKPCEMDQPMWKYATKVNFDLYLVKKTKVYAPISTTENTEETLITNYIEGKPLIIACKKEKIFDILTNALYEDEKFTNIIFLTYRNFATPTEFLENLIRTFYVHTLFDSTDIEKETFGQYSLATRQKVLRVLHNWIENHWHDFGQSTDLRALLNAFLAQISKEDNSEYADVAKGMLFVADIQRRWFEDLLNSYNMEEKKGKKIASMLESIESEVVAEQVSILDSDLFRNIHPIEILNEIWKKNGDEPSPSFQFFADRFNKESYWAATEIISQRDLKQRIIYLRKFIFIIKRCLELNNFFTAFSLIFGLNLLPVQRLKKTWEGLPEKAKQVWSEVEKVSDPSKNMKNYRDRLQAASPPMVPFLPIYLKDLTFMNDGNASKVKGMININKLRMMADRVQEIVSLGSTIYPFERKPAILNWLNKAPIEMSIDKLTKLAAALESQS